MKIYTRLGDDGTTSLAGGERVPKDHPKIYAYGTVDELIAWMALLRSLPENTGRKELLESVMDKLMHCAALLSVGKGAKTDRMKIPSESDISTLERAIDKMEEDLERLDSFILPGGTTGSSYANIARTVCRRAERDIINLSKTDSVDNMIVKYSNRLSDLLFVLSRTMLSEAGGKETKWTP